MKKLTTLVFASMLGGILTLGSYKIWIEEEETFFNTPETTSLPNVVPVSYDSSIYGTNADFTAAAERTVHGVVHVKNVAVFKQRNSLAGKALRGAGSGVIISPDGYIVTNNHVIDKANEIEVTLNNNQTYKAKVIGTDPVADIALIKIEAQDLDYIAFGNSNDVKLGEWVLAVGNPLNLTSTVTAGIISAKARDLNTDMMSPKSYIQTDAAINPGNSGGALVNINGDLIGINTLISSQTGSYVGYAFAVPSNNVRKIVEDIMEYGNVQKGILGIRGYDVNTIISKEKNLPVAQGVLVSDVDGDSGAAIAGVKENDVILQIDNINVRKMADLTGYIGSKRPGDVVNLTILRNGKQRDMAVEITKYETYAITPIGLEVTNASKDDLKQYKISNGVKISRALKGDKQTQALIGIIITKLDNQPVSDIEDVKKIMSSLDPNDPLSVTFVNSEGKELTYIWR